MKKFQKRAAALTLAACLLFQNGMTAFGAGPGGEAEAAPEATAFPETEAVPEPTALPEESTAPEPTALPEESTAPEATALPEEEAAPEATALPETEAVPEPTALPEETPAPELPQDLIVLPEEGTVPEPAEPEISQEGRRRLEELTADKAVLALVYLSESYGVMSGPESDGDVIAQVQSGQTVQILGAEISETGQLWYETGFYLDEVYYQGFIERDYLATSDEDLLEWERGYLPASREELVRAVGNQDIEAFPDSYRAALSALKSRHPNWTFVKMNTNLDWNTVVKNELGERSLVEYICSDLWKNGQYSKNWYYATEDILKHFLDPRNYLSDENIFAFEQLTYNSTYHTEAAVQNILNSTFMSGKIPDSDKTYARAFYEIGSSLKVSPFHLASRVFQEQGRGTSALISGTYKGYEGYYNYFNIGASGNTDQKVITSGLERAKKEGWDTRYKALSGGARIISQDYILKGQDTLYLQKFDVDASYNGLYWHQYQQNICAPWDEGEKIRGAYISTNSLENPFVFKIPVYNNMPSSACPEPGKEQPLPADCPFSDVEINPGSWKYESIKYVYANDIMNGINGTTRFAPDEPLTRGMFATVLYRMAGEPPVQYENRFADVEAGRYYSDAVIWAYQKGIVQGVDDRRYGTEENITREQIAKMLMEYAKVQQYDRSERASLDGFPDKGSVSGWAVEYMQWAVGCGMIGGRNHNGTNYLEPKGNATRAECAAMLMRFQNKYKK